MDVAPHLDTSGVDEFAALHKSGHFPGLGMAKKISIKHHIEYVYLFSLSCFTTTCILGVRNRSVYPWPKNTS